MIEEANRLKEYMAKKLILDDWEVVDLVLGIVAAHKVSHTEMLWVKIIGASGTGKTEILRAIQRLDCAEAVEHITPASLRGGYTWNRRGEPMLLERIDGKIAVTKEFNVLLTARKEDRNTVFGLMRAIHDGELNSDFGSRDGHLHQESRFDWLVGTTDYVERERQLEQSLGSRFIDIRWLTPKNRKGIGEQAIANDPELAIVRDELAQLMQTFVNAVNPVSRPYTPWLGDLADFTAKLRTPIKRDSRLGEIMEVPAIESPARVSQAMARIATGLHSLGVDNIQPYMVRLALDTIPQTRAKIIRANMQEITSLREVASYCGLSVRAISYAKEEMHMLGYDDYTDLTFLRPQTLGFQTDLELFKITERGNEIYNKWVGIMNGLAEAYDNKDDATIRRLNIELKKLNKIVEKEPKKILSQKETDNDRT